MKADGSFMVLTRRSDRGTELEWEKGEDIAKTDPARLIYYVYSNMLMFEDKNWEWSNYLFKFLTLDLTKNKQEQGWVLPTGWETETVGTFMEDKSTGDDDSMEMVQV